MIIKLKVCLYNFATVLFAFLALVSIGSFDAGTSFAVAAIKTASFVFLAYKSYIKFDEYDSYAKTIEKRRKVKVYRNTKRAKAA